MEKDWEKVEKTRKRNLALRGHESDQENAEHNEEDEILH